MVYNSKLVVAVKVKNKVVREHGDTIYLPYNSEYSILIKNLDTRKAIVNITIDGTDVVDGTGLVVEPNRPVNLERFISNNDSGHRFKFIERTENIENHRGVGLEDGLIRIEYQFAKEVIKLPIMQPRWEYDNHTPTWKNPHDLMPKYTLPLNQITSNVSSDAPSIKSILRSTNLQGSSSSEEISVQSMHVANDVGITVAGSVSDQKFSTVDDFPLEDEAHVIVMKILGETEDNKPIKKVTTTRTKQTCPTCGRKNRAKAKFCAECGTSLTVI